jgi:hypothetical protein
MQGGAPNATATATGGASTGGAGGSGGVANASSTATTNNGAANAAATATGGNLNGAGTGGVSAGAANASSTATANNGAANATATATGGSLTGLGISGAATANSTATANNGAANATATATGGASSVSGGIAGVANATSSALTINGNAAQAQSTATGSSGQARATAQTNFGNFQSVQSSSTSPLGGTTAANAFAQAGGIVSPSNPITAGQSFSVVTGFSFLVPLTVATGSMGAGYGGTGISVTYQQNVTFTQNGGAFVLDLLSKEALGNGFDSALFQISLNSVIVDSYSFLDLASAEAFFSNRFIDVRLLSGPNNIQIGFSETMSSPQGFSFDYAAASTNVPGPVIGTGLPSLVFASGGLFAWLRQRRKALSRTPLYVAEK